MPHNWIHYFFVVMMFLGSFSSVPLWQPSQPICLRQFFMLKLEPSQARVSWVLSRLFSVQNHSLSNLIHHEWVNHQLNNWFLMIPKPKLCCYTCHCYHQVDHLVGWIKRNQKDSIRIIFLSDFWVPIALIHFFHSGIKRNQMFEWAVFTQLKTA